MIIHNLDPVLIDLGFFQIKWYSIAYILGIVLGWFYASIIIKNYNNITNINQQDFEDLIIYLILGIILGGRLGYVIFYDPNYYIQNFFEIFKVWHGGMSFHGGVLGVVISTFVFAKVNKSNFFNFTDIIACVAPIGLFLGRIANFINGELFGKVSTLPWAVVFPDVDNLARHPSQIYEAILEGIVLFVLINIFALKKKLLKKTGYISGLFLVLYSILRIISENFREPDKHIGYIYQNISMGIILSIITLLLGSLIIIFVRKNAKNN
tara:strand:+ start:1688 stop:2485 length:798 start_codon:yes stop_codon:yes gene_type:complete